MNSRETAAEIIARWLISGEFPDRMMDAVESDRSFVMEAVYGAVKHKRTLEWVVQKLSRGRMDERAVPYLYVGLYQALYMTNVAEYAIVNETVEASKKKLSGAAAGFVNALLRRGLREKAAILREIKNQALGIRESHPDILVDRWKTRYAAGKTMRLCKWNNSRPDVVLCINTLKTTADDYAARLQEAGIEVVPHVFAPKRCFVVPHGVAVTGLPGYAEGLFSIQDPSMLMPVRLLGPRPGETVLDACAAPGGKTVLIAERMNGEGNLVAMELRKDRLPRLAENLERLEADWVKIVAGDAASPRQALGNMRFDRILVDAPCTNTGVLRRRADARWRFSMERLNRLVSLQLSIMDGVAPLLAPGGAIVYCVCSIEPEEGRDMIAGWLKTHGEFKIACDEAVFPMDTETDGLYAARICRKT